MTTPSSVQGEVPPFSSRSLKVRTDSLDGSRTLSGLLSKRAFGSSSTEPIPSTSAVVRTKRGCRIGSAISRAPDHPASERSMAFADRG